MKTIKLEKSRAHQIYLASSGAQVPGVTTILGIIAKPALIHWAWGLGMQKKDYRKEKDKAADIGTIAHFMCEGHVKKFKPDLSDFSKSDIKVAEGCRDKFITYWKQQKFKLVYSEKQLVSDEHLFGGTLDLIADSPLGLTLLDIKNSKGIYPEYWRQVAAYAQLWKLNVSKFPLVRHVIVRLGKEDADIEVVEKADLTREWKIFEKTNELYHLLNV